MQMLICDWCAGPIETDGYSEDEIDRLGLSGEDTAQFVVLEARYGDSRRRGVYGHFHSPHCWADAMRLIGDHRRWAKRQEAGRHGAELPRWDSDELTASGEPVPKVGLPKDRLAETMRRVDETVANMKAVEARERNRHHGKATQRDPEQVDPWALGTPIRGDLPMGTYAALCRAKLETFEALAELSEKQLRRVPQIGEKSVRAIKESMAAHGFWLRVPRPLDRLTELRHASGMKYADVARRLGVQGYEFRRWETGTERPSAEHVDALAKLFGVSKGFLIGEQS